MCGRVKYRDVTLLVTCRLVVAHLALHLVAMTMRISAAYHFHPTTPYRR